MSGFINAIIGSVTALLLLGIAVLLRKHYRRMPRFAPKWLPEVLLTSAIVLSLLAGVEMAYGGAGSWIVTALTWVKGMLGAAGPVVFALAGLALFIGVVLAIVGSAEEKVVTTAFLLPLVAATFSAGFFASLNAALAPPAQAIGAHIAGFLGV